MFNAFKKWPQIQLLFLLLVISACKTNSYSEDFTIAPNVIMSSSVFSDIKPKILKKEKEKFNVNYWVWKNNDKVIQIATFAAKAGIYFTDENYNADKIINAFPNLKKKDIDNKSQVFFVYTNLGIFNSVFFTVSEQTCFSAISSFNDSGLHDWPGSRQKLYINYCEDGYAKLQLKNIEYFLQRIYTGTKGYEKLIMDGKVISDKTSDKRNLKRDQNADSTPSNSIKNITLPIKIEWNGVGEGMRGTIIVPDLRKWKYPEVPVKLTLGNINCDGSSIAQSGDWSKGETAKGVFTLKCSNGRVVTGTYTSPAAGQGIGKGKDDNGFEFLYVYGAGAT